MEKEISTQEDWVLHRLNKFYTLERIQKVKDILSGKLNISLRILDWFVTNYAKGNNVSYVTATGRHVIVYLAYKSHLKAYSKKCLIHSVVVLVLIFMAFQQLLDS